MRLLNTEMPDAEPVCFCRDVKITSTVSIITSMFYLRSNREGKNFGLYHTHERDEQQWGDADCANARDVMLEDSPVYRLVGG